MLMIFRFLSVRSVDDYLSTNNRMRMYIRVQIVELVIQLSLQQDRHRKDYLMFRLDPVIVDMASTFYLDKNGKPVDCGYALYASVGAFKMADKSHQSKLQENQLFMYFNYFHIIYYVHVYNVECDIFCS